MVIGKTTQGKDFNFYQVVNVTDNSFPTTPQCVINIATPRIGLILFNAGSTVVDYSFNGNTLHGTLSGLNDGYNTFTFLNRAASKIFFRVASGSTTVMIQSW